MDDLFFRKTDLDTTDFLDYLKSFEGGKIEPTNENIFIFNSKKLAFYFLEMDNSNIEREYLQNLVFDYKAKGYHLIIIFKADWYSKNEIIVSRINAMFGKVKLIHGRKTSVKRIDKAAAEIFLNQNHLQAYVSSKIKYGLFLEQELVAVATFSAGRKMNDKPQDFRSYELIRFANKNGCRVYGGLSKLLNAFILNHKPGNIMTYADLCWSTGESYLKLGFEQVGILLPQMNYFQQTNPDNFTADNTYGIWNAGSLKFILSINQN